MVERPTVQVFEENARMRPTPFSVRVPVFPTHSIRDFFHTLIFDSLPVRAYSDISVCHELNIVKVQKFGKIV